MRVAEKEAAGAERVPTLFINITTTPSTSQGLINIMTKGDLGGRMIRSLLRSL